MSISGGGFIVDAVARRFELLKLEGLEFSHAGIIKELTNMEILVNG